MKRPTSIHKVLFIAVVVLFICCREVYSFSDDEGMVNGVSCIVPNNANSANEFAIIIKANCVNTDGMYAKNEEMGAE